MADSTHAGRIFAVDSAGADIQGFDPAHDKLDLGDVSVHNFIPVDTPTGIGFLDPWSGETQVVVGVSLGQLTVDSFLPVTNDHLRQCLSGALAWEQGITPEPDTVYARSHELGRIDRVAFDPATDVVDFRYYASREQIAMADGAEGVVISNAGTGQALILLGVTLAELTVRNFVFYPAQVREDRVHLQLGFATVPDSQILDQGVPIVGTDAWPSGIGAGDPPSGATGTTYAIAWQYGTDTVLDFDPAVDRLDFGWFKAPEFSVAETGGSTVISIASNRQTYTLGGVGLGELEMGNILALDPGARAEWQAVLDAAPPPPMQPAISLRDAQVVEGDDGARSLVFTASLSAAATAPLSVGYTTRNGSARAGEDFAATVGTLGFAIGETEATFAIPVFGDRLTELTETLTVQLSAPSGATILDGTAIGSIIDDDADPAPGVPPSITILDYATEEGDAGLTHMRIVLTLSKASAQPVTVRYVTEDGTATGDADYERLGGTVTFAPGETSQTIHAHIFGDTLGEPTEGYRIRLSDPVGASLADGVAVVTVIDDDRALPPPTLSIADASVVEGDAGSRLMRLTVTLSRAATGTVTVDFATANGTATAGSDYAGRGGTLRFAAGETIATIEVPLLGDTQVEADETFAVRLKDPTGATIADGTGTATITNDDAAPGGAGGAVSYAVTDDWGAGFVADMTVTAGAAGLDGWTVAFDAPFAITGIWNAEIVSHTGTHYVIRNAAHNGTVAPGGATSFGFQASGGASDAVTGLTLNDAGATPVPSVSVADAAVLEGVAGPAGLLFRLSLSAPSDAPVTIGYATGDGSATAWSDYLPQSGTVTFAAGETTRLVRILVAGDSTPEADETLRLTLSSATGAAIGDGVALGTIRNDDVPPAGPILSVGNARVTEGDAGSTGLVFTVSLSSAAATPVTVGYSTADATARAGADYTPRSGTLTFAPGETSKVVTVAVRGDAGFEADEWVALTLSSTSGAAIGTGTGFGLIQNDDARPLPALSIRDAAVIEGDAPAGAGWFSTAGNQIVDDAGAPVKIAGVNWFGFEGTNMSPNGLWTRGYQEMMDQMLAEGFNTIRLPFSSDMLHATTPALGIDAAKNPDLVGLTPIEVMDRIVAYAGEIGLRIILDHHRSDAGAGTSANGLWYDAQHTEAQWIADWQMLAARYADQPAVIGADLHNEPYNGSWGGGGANDWARAAEAAGNAIGEANPNWLIFVEGIASYGGENYWWGGNLMGVCDRPIVLDVDDKLVYSAHDYPNSIYPQPWFQGPDFPGNLPETFDGMWGYIHREEIAPVLVGEFGTKLTDPKDVAWFEAITAYLGGDFDLDGDSDLAPGEEGIGWTYWSWNPNSGDTGGILQDDWRTVNEDKLAYLQPIMFDLPGTDGAAASYAEFTVVLSAPAATTVTVAYETVAATASEADFVASAGTVSFAPGEQSKRVRIAILGDMTGEPDEAFGVVLRSPVGATIADGTGIGTIADDDPAPAATLSGDAIFA